MFTAIYADKAEYGSHSKVDLLAMPFRDRAVSNDSAWMIGDRIFDFEAARANRIRCMAAGWGYGPQEEVVLADGVAINPGTIRDHLFFVERKRTENRPALVGLSPRAPVAMAPGLDANRGRPG